MAEFTTDIVKTTLSGSLEFTCSHCGYVGQAQLSATAQGDAVRNATRADSRVVAHERAQHAANKAFERASLIIRCPKCESFDPEKLRLYRQDRARALAIIWVFAALAFAGSLAASDLGMRRLGWLVALTFGASGLQPLLQIFRPPKVDVTFAGHSPTAS